MSCRCLTRLHSHVFPIHMCSLNPNAFRMHMSRLHPHVFRRFCIHMSSVRFLFRCTATVFVCTLTPSPTPSRTTLVRRFNSSNTLQIKRSLCVCRKCALCVSCLCLGSVWSWVRWVMVLNTSTCFRYLNVTFVEMYGMGWWRWGRHTWLLVLGTRAHLGLVALNPRDTRA